MLTKLVEGQELVPTYRLFCFNVYLYLHDYRDTRWFIKFNKNSFGNNFFKITSPFFLFGIELDL